MKKIITTTVLSALLLTNTLIAKEKFTFMGVSVSKKTLEFYRTPAEKKASVGIRFGMQNKGYRVMLKAEKNFKSLREYSIETDVLYRTIKIDKLLFKPYAGVSVGRLTHKNNDKYSSMYGLHFGTLFNLDDNFDFDISYNMKDKRDGSLLRKYRDTTFAVHYYF